jgi:GntR family transcriptional regulator
MSVTLSGDFRDHDTDALSGEGKMETRSRRTGAQRLHQNIAQLLSDSGLEPGDQIPTEAELTERLGAARPTIREALKLLEQEGMIRAKHGRGRFLTAVASMRIDRPITAFESITEMAAHLGYTLTNKLLSVSEELPSSEVASALRLANGETIIRLERLRLSGREPVIYGVDHIPRAAIADRIFDLDWTGSLLEALERYDARPTMSQARVRAAMLPEEVVRRHDLGDFGPALIIEETAYRTSGGPVIYALDYHSGRHFAFSFLRK